MKINKNKQLIGLFVASLLLGGCNAGISGNAVGNSENSDVQTVGTNLKLGLANNEFAYILGSQSIFSYRVQSDGKFTSMHKITLADKPLRMSIDNFGNYIYVSTQSKLLTYPLTGHNVNSKMPSFTLTSHGKIQKILISPDGNYLYTLNNNLSTSQKSGSIAIYKIYSDGFLKEVSGSPFNSLSGVYPEDMQFIGNSNNYYLAVTNSNNHLKTYQYSDKSNSSLVEVSDAITAIYPGLLVVNNQKINIIGSANTIKFDSMAYTFIANTYPSSGPANHQTLVVQAIHTGNGKISNSYTPEILAPYDTPLNITFDQNNTHLIVTGNAFHKRKITASFVQIYDYDSLTGAIYAGGDEKNITMFQGPILSSSFDVEQKYFYLGSLKSIIFSKINSKPSNFPLGSATIETTEPTNQLLFKSY